MHKLLLLVLPTLLMFIHTNASAQMYKWVDEQGKVHFGDSVPLKYQQQADAINSFSAPTEEQKREARQAAERTKALSQDYDFRKQEERVRAEVHKAVGIQGDENSDKNKEKKVPAKKGCAAKLKQFHESARCFNNFRNANGSLKAGAYEKCKDVSRPDECF